MGRLAHCMILMISNSQKAFWLYLVDLLDFTHLTAAWFLKYSRWTLPQVLTLCLGCEVPSEVATVRGWQRN